jgi:hypothetical protein
MIHIALNVNVILFSQMNHAELSPNYSGFLFSITNTFASIPGFVAPLVMGAITKDNVRVKTVKSIH